jgi:hypothetical protein
MVEPKRASWTSSRSGWPSVVDEACCPARRRRGDGGNKTPRHAHRHRRARAGLLGWSDDSGESIDYGQVLKESVDDETTPGTLVAAKSSCARNAVVSAAVRGESPWPESARLIAAM